jgi:hypothetical protein
MQIYLCGRIGRTMRNCSFGRRIRFELLLM